MNYEKALDILMKICQNIDRMSTGLWICEENYKKISIEYISYIYDANKFNYSIRKNPIEIIINFNNGSKLILTKYNQSQTNIRGRRYDFLFIDVDITISNIFYLGRIVCTKMFPPGPFSFEDEKRCNKCLCKTCSIAYENGGAEGCGDCFQCKLNDCIPVKSCQEYYNQEPPRINYRRRR